MENRSPELAVVIPVYNEEKAIGGVLDKLVAELDRLKIDYQVHAYNDGSRDGSLDVLKKYALGREQIIVHDKENSGHGPTILLGYRSNCDKQWIFQIDSDDEMSLDSFERLWVRRRDFDFLIGKRSGRNSPFVRRLISLVSRVTVRLFYGAGVYDVNTPYRLMRTEVFKDYFAALPSDTAAPNIILSGIACLKKLRVYETPVDYNFRQTGEVSIKKLKLLKFSAWSFLQTIGFRFHL